MEQVLDKILNEFGTQTAMAEALGVRQQSVSEWFANGRIPARRALEVSRLTGIPVEDLLAASHSNSVSAIRDTT